MPAETIASVGQRAFPGEYVVGLGKLASGLALGLTNGTVQLLSDDASSVSGVSPIKAHESSILGLEVVDPSGVVATCGADSVKLWDVRAGGKQVHKFTLDGRQNALTCMASSGGRVVAGTELKSQDAGVVMWDVRTTKPVVSYMESHNDDVTMVGFHPSDPTGLISGSTDGLVNLYNTSIADEDDALFQTVNHGASIHKAGFLSEKRLFALSHMETMAIYSVYDADENKEEMSGKLDLGDVRGPLACDYVADVLDGLVAVGKENDFRLIPLVQEQPQPDSAYILQGGHGEEIVRTVLLDSTNRMVYTGGEDGIVRYWRADIAQAEQPSAAVLKADDEDDDDKKEKKHKHKHKHKHKSKDKDEDSKERRHHKDKKKKSKVGFKPY